MGGCDGWCIMFTIKNKFSICPVGQGFFYTGCLTSYGGGAQFNFVYDCGSVNRLGGISIVSLRQMIDRYIKQDLPCRLLDMLVISHFDADHVNGVSHLLRPTNGVKVTQLYVPYYCVDDFLLTILWIHIYNLYDRIDQIIFVGDADDLYDSYRVTEIKYKIQMNPTVLMYQFGWKFVFYNNPVQHGSIGTLQRLIDKLMLQENCTRLSQLLQKKEVIPKLKKYYKDNIKPTIKDTGKDRINNTSLCLYHGPIVGIESMMKVFYISSKMEECESIPLHVENLPIGSLLTGDLSLMAEERYRKFVGYYQDEIGYVGSFFLPHHGASNSWNSRIIDDFSKAIFFVSYGTNNRYGHPGKDLKSHLFHCGRHLCLVNEWQGVGYSFYIPVGYLKRAYRGVWGQ